MGAAARGNPGRFLVVFRAPPRPCLHRDTSCCRPRSCSAAAPRPLPPRPGSCRPRPSSCRRAPALAARAPALAVRAPVLPPRPVLPLRPSSAAAPRPLPSAPRPLPPAPRFCRRAPALAARALALPPRSGSAAAPRPLPPHPGFAAAPGCPHKKGRRVLLFGPFLNAANAGKCPALVSACSLCRRTC